MIIIRNYVILSKKKAYTFEIIAFLLYAAALILIMYYHEPWFDEAQSWLIARDSTIRELLGSITHYEGHPPIWFLILMPFAKCGIPFEIGIKAVNFTFVTLAMGIFIFKAPFKRFIRISLPFTYFFFYQFGVISRTYSMMMLGFVLSALFYKDRNKKPFRFVLGLIMICGASAYGMIIAAGIAIIWLFEILHNSFSLYKIIDFLKSRQFYALLILFLINLFYAICIIPYHDNYASASEQAGSGFKLFYLFLMAPADTLCTLVFSNSPTNSNSYMQMGSSIFISIMIYAVLAYITSKYKKFSLFAIPYLLFIIFGGIVYFLFNNLGIIALFFMFILWCCYDQNSNNSIKFDTDSNSLSFIPMIMVFALIGISIYWSVSASINDIKYNYGTGREASVFIEENNLDKLNILSSWRVIEDGNGDNFYDYNSLQGIPMMAYFNSNIIYNLNEHQNNKCYLLHKIEKEGKYTNTIINEAYPDVLIGSDSYKETFGDKINKNDFTLVKSVHGNTIWKDNIIENRFFIYLRRDLLKNYPSMIELDVREESAKENNSN